MNATTTYPEDTAVPVERPTLGVERFIQRGLAVAGGRRIGGRGSRNRPGATYQAGWAKGLTQDQATEKARGMYSGLGDSVREKYEKQAQMLDVVSNREQGVLERPPVASIPSPGGAGAIRPMATPSGRVDRLPASPGMVDMPMSPPGGRVVGEPISPLERPSLRNVFDEEDEDQPTLMERMRARQARAAARPVGGKDTGAGD